MPTTQFPINSLGFYLSWLPSECRVYNFPLYKGITYRINGIRISLDPYFEIIVIDNMVYEFGREAIEVIRPIL